MPGIPPALHGYEFDDRGFEWTDCNDAQNSVLVYQRRSDDEVRERALDFTPVPRTGDRVGVPRSRAYLEILNSDSEHYGGSNMGNGPGLLMAENQKWMNNPCSLTVILSPPAGIILKAEGTVKEGRIGKPMAEKSIIEQPKSKSPIGITPPGKAE